MRCWPITRAWRCRLVDEPRADRAGQQNTRCGSRSPLRNWHEYLRMKERRPDRAMSPDTAGRAGRDGVSPRVYPVNRDEALRKLGANVRGEFAGEGCVGTVAPGAVAGGELAQ